MVHSKLDILGKFPHQNIPISITISTWKNGMKRSMNSWLTFEWKEIVTALSHHKTLMFMEGLKLKN